MTVILRLITEDYYVRNIEYISMASLQVDITPWIFSACFTPQEVS